jgi:hypothetical protein
MQPSHSLKIRAGISTLMGVSEIVCFAVACTLRALESASASALDGPDENSPHGVKARTTA